PDRWSDGGLRRRGSGVRTGSTQGADPRPCDGAAREHRESGVRGCPRAWGAARRSDAPAHPRRPVAAVVIPIVERSLCPEPGSGSGRRSVQKPDPPPTRPPQPPPNPASDQLAAMPSPSHPLQFVLVALAGWLNQQQRDVIDYLQEENRSSKLTSNRGRTATGRSRRRTRRFNAYRRASRGRPTSLIWT